MTTKFDHGHDLERWGLRIYRIVTGVTSDVGVPSTRLVVLVVNYGISKTVVLEILQLTTKPLRYEWTMEPLYNMVCGNVWQ